MKSFRLAATFVALVFLLASCTKTSNSGKVGILTSHKWLRTSSTTSYSDTSLITNNLRYDTLPCQKDGYREFRDYVNNSTTRVFYDYTESKCLGESADVTTGAWDIDQDQNFLTFSSSTGGGQSFSWAITSLDDSKIVLTSTQSVQNYRNTNTPPYYTYYTVTTTSVDTWTAK